MFSGPTQHAVQVDSVMLFIVVSSVILLLGVTAAMLYFVFRYSRKKNPKPSNIHGNTTLEIVWIVIPTILVLFMFYYGWVIFKESREVPEDAMHITVTGRMWAWEFNYPNGITTDTLFLPVGQSVKLNLVSADINHSFYIPAFRIKEDIMSGRENYMVIKPKEIGSYDIACAEYCGMNHSLMYSKLIVLSKTDYYDWVKLSLNSNTSDNNDETKKSEINEAVTN